MAEAVVTFLLEKLQQLVVNEIHLLSGVDRELKQLYEDLELMNDFLSHSTNKRETLTRFERDIREVIYEVEDMIDVYLMQVAADHKSKRFVFSRLKRPILAKTLRAFTEEKLRPLLHQVKASADASATTAQHPNTQHQGVPLLREDNVVGFEDEANTVIKYLHEESEKLDIISIIGMCGLGKTTLARKIYQDPVIQNEFPYLFWVYASEESNMRDAFLTILSKFTEEDMSELPNVLLADIVRNNLEYRRFLMIIDGVHTTQDWRVIEVALPKTNGLGKVLLTTRYQQVAREANCNREPHMLRFLSFEESWELLQLQVFGRNNDCPPELEGMGKKIAEQCGGLPLALVVLGRILVEQGFERKDAWEKVSNSVRTYLHYDGQKRTEMTISLSYNKLPYHLRDCFLYLGMFPKDTEIPVWKLIRLWIAEGFIQQDRGKSLEEVAGDYVNDLVARNLVMVGKTKANGDVKTCRVHDMIREFSQNEAAFANMNLFQEVKKTGQGVFDPAISEFVQCRRLCIHSNVIEFLRQNPKGPKVRSFVCFSKESINLDGEDIGSIPEAFDLLRVVDVSPIKFPHFPPNLTKLIHLRYIALSGNEFRDLPGAVSMLRNLQTIKIDTTSHQFEIRADIWKMMQLRHLKTKAAIVFNMEAKGEGGENLQTLSRLSTQSLTNDICERAFNLKNLGIRGDLNTLMNTTCLARLDRLEKLKLLHDTPSQIPLIGLPNREAFPPNLMILELSSTCLEWKHMSTLDTLPTLEVLKLKDNAFVGSLWKVDDGCFPSLEVLQIEGTDLEVWTASEDSFPRLRCLVLKKCEKLEEIPRVLERSLQVVDIESVNKSAVESARRIEMEKQDQPRATRKGFKLTVVSRGETQ